jgi:hypothetical protein
MIDKVEASPLACDMSAIAPEQREEHLATSRELFSHVVSIRELTNGYAFELRDGPNVIVKAAEFISLEKLCCPFLRFAVEVEAERGPVSLHVTGREGVKEFVREEINGILGGPIDWR